MNEKYSLGGVISGNNLESGKSLCLLSVKSYRLDGTYEIMAFPMFVSEEPQTAEKTMKVLRQLVDEANRGNKSP